MKNFFAILFGLLVVAAGVGLLDLVYRGQMKSVLGHKNPFIDPEDRYAENWLGIPRRVLPDSFYLGSEEVYNVRYRLDEVGRRHVTPNENANEFAVFFGGSNLFGQGLNNHETVPQKFQNLYNDYQSYIYARQGYGPLHALAQVQSEEFGKDIYHQKGILFYFYFPFHIHRTRYNTINATWVKGQIPRTYVENDRLKVRSTVAQSPNWLDSIIFGLSKSSIIQKFRLRFPGEIKGPQKVACQALESLHNAVQEKLGETQFVFVYMEEEAPLVKTCKYLQKQSVVELSYFEARRSYGENQSFTYKEDGHWTTTMGDYTLGKISHLMKNQALAATR